MGTLTETKKLENFKKIFERCGQRAHQYDHENQFFQEDFEELKDAGYLLMPVPEDLGGFGLLLAEVSQKQRELAYHAAPTALGLNMHFYWLGSVADLWRQGDRSLVHQERIS